MVLEAGGVVDQEGVLDNPFATFNFWSQESPQPIMEGGLLVTSLDAQLEVLLPFLGDSLQASPLRKAHRVPQSSPS